MRALIDILSVTPGLEKYWYGRFGEKTMREQWVPFEKAWHGYVEAHGEFPTGPSLNASKSSKQLPGREHFLGHLVVVGLALTWLVCLGPKTVVPTLSLFEKFSLAQFTSQARSENHRGGQTESATHYDLSRKGTIDDVVLSKPIQRSFTRDRLLSSRKNFIAKKILSWAPKQFRVFLPHLVRQTVSWTSK